MTFAPVIFLSLALLLMVVTMILLSAYLRRNEYEDYDIELPNHIFHSLSNVPETFNLYRLKAFFKSYKGINLS